jgi:hypothetical protein
MPPATGYAPTVLAVTLAAGLWLAPHMVAGKSAPASKDSPVKLFGQIDELSMMCSSAGIKLTGTSLPAKVAKVSLGSAASYSGIRQDDTVVAAHPEGMQLVVTIERNGKRYQSSVATDIHGLQEQFEKRGIKWAVGEGAFDKELQQLERFNVVILLDRSASMDETHAGCPGDLSKWAWCKQQLDGLYFATARLLDNGFDLVPFNDNYQRWNDVTLWDLKRVFDSMKPQGTDKNIAKPLEAVIEDRLRWNVHKDKPLLIVVLSDGKQNMGRPLENVLTEAAAKISHQRDLTVVFLQVGDSIVGQELFNDLDQNLVAKGARYHMVSYKPFSELRQKGLVWEIVTAAKQTFEGGIKTPGSL